MKRLAALTYALSLAVVLLAPTGAAAQVSDLPLPADDVSAAATPSVDARPDVDLPDSITSSRIAAPITRTDVVAPSKLEASLLDATGPQRVIVRFVDDEVAMIAARGGDRAAQQDQFARLRAQQQDFVDQARGLDAGVRVLGEAQRVLNAVMIEVDAADLARLAADPNVESIKRIKDYELDLSETVPYIGAAAVQGLGFDGTGVSVAVLDSGVDYYHANLGGSGDPNDYTADDPTIIEAGTFPTAKVVGGYDFVGGDWPNSPEAPDPDPLDDGPQAGHGTHVADIIAGNTPGVAPGASIYAVKVCSSVSTSCSGVALINGMDFSVDPNGDGAVDDAVDVINMSLGATYGQSFDDDLSQAVENASAIGVLTVASAGNSADKPFITGTPSAAPSALSVAQTHVPSAIQPLMEVTSPDSIAGQYAAIFQPWSGELTSAIEAPLLYGDGAGGNLDGCAPFADGSLTGFIVLVDRGSCFFSDKIRNVENGGGLIGIIGLVAPGDPFGGGFGGGDPISIPGYMISQADANTLRSGLPDTVVRFDPAVGLPLIMHMVGSSSRGPAMSDQIIKPEIGAPGASISAVAGSGTDTEPFGGTSGAAPMVSGSAALLMQAYPDRSWAEIKSVLMNTAEVDILNEPEFFGGDVAPITRIGGGEVRVDRALASPAAAWDSSAGTGALSFGFHNVTTDTVTLTRQVTIRNYSGSGVGYNITPTFRFDDDALNGAVSVVAPGSVSLPPFATKQFTVKLTIDGAALPDWVLNSGGSGADGGALSAVEFDGYLVFDNPRTAETDDLHMAWQVLPRKSALVQPATSNVRITGDVDGIPAGFATLTNAGIGTAEIDTFELVAVSPNLPEGGLGAQSPVVDFRYVGVNTFPVPAGFCSEDESFVMALAVTTWERQTHANAPAAFEFDLDVDRNGSVDYAVFNQDLSGGLSDGRNVTWVLDVAAGTASAFFFTAHSTLSANTQLFFCGEQIGMNATNFGQKMSVTGLAVDIYFQGAVTDVVGPMIIAPLGERYLGLVDPIDPGSSGVLTMLDFGSVNTNKPSRGVLMHYLDGSAIARPR